MSIAMEKFPRNAQKFLETIYQGNGISDGTEQDKIDLLKKNFDLEGLVIAAHEGIGNDAEELRALEFYLLTKQGLL